MKNTTLLLLTCIGIITHPAHGQNIDRIITKKDVTRIIKTLSANDMMGRPSTQPARIEKATAFIEHEFKNIGLTPLHGLTGYRQEFYKESIQLLQIQATINNTTVASENIALVSDNKEINIQHGLTIKTIEYNKSPAADQNFFQKAIALARDTASTLILVDPAFEKSFKELKAHFDSRILNTQSRGTKVFILGAVSVSTYSINAQQKIESIKMTNVVGMLPGKQKADEIVIFGAHYDHLGIRATPNTTDSIANGADDDASGTTAVIALARYFKKVKTNNRTIIFAAFTAEEIGGYGAAYFSTQLNANNVVAMFNIEMIGKPSKWGQQSAFITGFELSDFGTILQNNLRKSTFQFKPDPYPEQNLFYRSDNATLARLGVPAHTISTDQIDNDALYHTVNDEFESIDIKNIINTIKAIATSAQSIINGYHTPTRIDTSAIR